MSPTCPSDSAPRIPETGADKLCPWRGAVTLPVTAFEHGGVSPAELDIIGRLSAWLSPARVFEIGTFNGRTTLALAANTPPGAVVFTLDLPETRQPVRTLRTVPRDDKYVALRAVGKHFRTTPYRDKIRCLSGDSASFDFGPYAGTMDMVFVDGSHSYEYVMNDSKKAGMLLGGSGGVLLWHDYAAKVWPEVTRALDELHDKDTFFSGMTRIAGTSLVLLRKVF